MTQGRYLTLVVLRDALVLALLLFLFMLPSMVGDQTWFARWVARVLPATPGIVRTGTTSVYLENGSLTFDPSDTTSPVVGVVTWTLSSSDVGMLIRPLQQTFTFSCVANSTPSTSTADIDSLVAREGVLVCGLHPHFEEAEAERVVMTPDGLDAFPVIQMRRKTKVVLYPLRTLGTLRFTSPWILRGYYWGVFGAALIGVFSIRTVRALRRQEKSLCMRCGYPRATTAECTECGLIYPRPLIELETVIH